MAVEGEPVKSVTIGIYLDQGFERLEASLAALRANTSGTFGLMLLPDGPDDATRARLAGYGFPTPDGFDLPVGAPACFNRLAAGSDADVLVFLEAGVIPGPGWLDGIVEALKSDPRNGLAGPSTNRAWNEQMVFSGAGGSLAEVARTAQIARLRFGPAWRPLEPLHSLADFCYAVRRDVVEAIGAADHEYYLGPCWEMDYNIRAARAGFRGVWACSSYVWRAPFTARREREESSRFETSKHRYQDKFCALRLRGERSDYEPHCRGDACEHFAPRSLIKLHADFPRGDTVPVPLPTIQRSEPARAEHFPMVSCVMATRDRCDYALQAIRYFERQDYPNRELIIIDDDGGELSRAIAPGHGIRYVRVARGLSIGAKRNRGCELARGRIIAQWDDDDWYSPHRISAQVAPLIAGDAEITALAAGLFFDLPKWRFWTCRPELHRRMFVEGVFGGSLVYLRACWEKLARYPDCSLAEDAALLREALRRGARLTRISEAGLYIYLRHGRNTWNFECGRFIDPGGWTQVAEPLLREEDRAFYAARCAASPPRRTAAPLVTCIMPTADRRPFVSHAIRYFLRQTYSNRELLILDDGADPIGDLIPTSEQIRYVRLERRHTLGAKRNLACGLARGDLIAHWDDDDWIADWRLAYQVQALERYSSPAVCGVSSLLFFEPRTGRAWTYVHPAGGRTWVAGGTLCYHKALWQRFPFAEISEGEDTRFIWSVPQAAVLSLSDNRFYVATMHTGNTSRKRTSDPRWRLASPEDLRGLMGADWPACQAAGRE